MQETPPIEEPKMDLSEAPDLTMESPNTYSKSNISGVINKAKDTVVGSKQLGTEIRRVGNDYVDLPVDAAKQGLTALKDLATLYPIKATKDVANGVVKAAGDMLDITSAPGRLAIAGTYELGRGAAWVLASPFKAWGVLNRGLEKYHQFVTRLAK
jgi:hypothetical protein